MADHGLFARPDAPHRVHDTLLVAAYAAGDVSAADRARGEALVASCPGCADLARDLGDIQRAIAAVPAPPRRRDFRLSAADAARVRAERDQWFRISVHRPRLQLAQPAAAGLTMLGLAGLLVATIPWTGSGPASEAAVVASGAPEDAVGAMPAASAPAARASGGPEIGVLSGSAPPSQRNGDIGVLLTPVASSAQAQQPVETEPSDLVRPAIATASVGLIGAGSALWVVARRRRESRRDGTRAAPPPSGT